MSRGNWRDSLRQACFRDADFLVLTGETAVGRRIARHEYPQRDTPYMEDMGKKAREYKIEAFILGPDYIPGRDALIAALEKPGAGQLVHPWLGEKQVTALSASITESTQDGGFCRVTIEFIEAGKEEEPHTTPDTEAAVAQSGMEMEDAAIADFGRDFSIKGTPDWSRLNTQNSLAEILAKGGIAADPALFAIMSDPVKFAQALIAKIKGTPKAAQLAGYKPAPEGATWHTASRARASKNSQAMSWLARSIATKEKTVSLAKIEAPTLDEARAARAEIVTLIDDLILTPNIWPATSDRAVQLRADAIAHFMAITSWLPRLARLTPQATRPAIVYAHEWYGDDWAKSGRDLEIIQRNRINHPGFIPPGRSLEFAA